MKLSFSIPSKTSAAAAAAVSATPQAFSDDRRTTESDSKPAYFTVFDGSQPLPAVSPSLVIPPIPNSDFRAAKKMKNLIPPPVSDDPDVTSDTQFVLDTSGADAPAGSIPYGLTIRESKSKDESEERDPQLAELRRFREDIKRLPADRGMEEFADVSVENFAAAVLAGYGWKEGMGIGRGNKEDVKVVQYDRRQGKEGLGYDPSSAKDSKKKDQKVAAKEEKIVRVIDGKHMGLRGKIVETLEKMDSDSPKVVVLKLLDSGEEVRLGGDMIAELGSVEEEKCLRKLKELDIRRRDEKKNRDRRMEEKRSRNGEKEATNGELTKSVNQGRKSNEKEREPVQWLRSHIRVRIISKDFKRGKWYLKKGKVVDVVGPMQCDISMDDNGELVQGVHQDILETAIPKRGGSVLVLYGRHEGVYGRLEERNTEKETGVVRDADSHALINVNLEQIAEYVGDPSYIGY
ncbi:G patch domain and KOW motifs-containing protein [Dioscorea alata]|uniref:G patch domain and KOW motifs-containing protein n=2 Tax=Dioscorea alata TaxID=55571 RepID=A0ACB7TZN0_DIOAL|nr:G patch domain and KOW motifs-containing protein [Dioscorea alata]KAH7653541.1 G patch domain and KOW motifs-containing protein [Dioscorea alata]